MYQDIFCLSSRRNTGERQWALMASTERAQPGPRLWSSTPRQWCKGLASSSCQGGYRSIRRHSPSNISEALWKILLWQQRAAISQEEMVPKGTPLGALITAVTFQWIHSQALTSATLFAAFFGLANYRESSTCWIQSRLLELSTWISESL